MVRFLHFTDGDLHTDTLSPETSKSDNSAKLLTLFVLRKLKNRIGRNSATSLFLETLVTFSNGRPATSPQEPQPPATLRGSCQLLSLFLALNGSWLSCHQGPTESRLTIISHINGPARRAQIRKWGPRLGQQVDVGGSSRSALAHTPMIPTKSNCLCFLPLCALVAISLGIMEVKRQSSWLVCSALPRPRPRLPTRLCCSH